MYPLSTSCSRNVEAPLEHTVLVQKPPDLTPETMPSQCGGHRRDGVAVPTALGFRGDVVARSENSKPKGNEVAASS